MGARALITGATGFAGGHLDEHLRAAGDEPVGVGREHGDLTDPEVAERIVREARPERVYHLAAAASVGESWRSPLATIDANVASTFNLLEAVRSQAPSARVLVAGSGEIYGPVPAERQPVAEHEPLRPQNPYAVSKASCDLLAGFFADAHGLHVVRTRAFNHAGPGQAPGYVVADFARQIAEQEAAGADSIEIVTGDLRPRRDFTDVRDVVRAYRLLVEGAPAGAYNVCSGVATSIGDILAGLSGHTRLDVRQRTDPGRLRKTEVMQIQGSHDKLTETTGWEPQIALDRTLADALDWWRSR